MTLASMMNLSEDALICDFAETYHIYDIRSLPVKLAATLAAGLRDDSRIKLKAAGSAVPLESMLLAMIADRIELFRYGFSENAAKKKDVPTSVLAAITGNNKQTTDADGFETPEEFDAWLAKIRGE